VRSVAIFGVGLIGGSFALALRRAGFTGPILGVSSPSTINHAVALGAIDRGCSLEEAASTADLILLAQPIRVILDTLPALDPLVRPDTLITDVGSTKSEIVARAAACLTRCQFLGGHPLAGKETRGVQAASAALFDNRTWVLTPRSASELDSPPAAAFLHWLRLTGAVPSALDPAEHDRILAFTSHLPQLVSTALAAALSSALPHHDLAASHLFGPALLDATRLALSPYGIWRDILETNKPAIRSALECYIIELQQVMELIDSPPESGLEREFSAAAEFSNGIRRPSVS
jgi:prephenate dehydrogenase